MTRPVLIFGMLLLASGFAQDVTLQGQTNGNFRFKDIGGQAFGQNFINTYSYANASVVFSFDITDNDYLSGTITATGLKPNYAYQIKLAGNPSAEAVTDAEKAAADDATNERLGRIGRWWRAAPSPGNSNDADYDINKTTSGYIYEGYLLIGFFVTDASGNANLRFDGNNSFHVLWRVDQRPRPNSDGPPLDVAVPDTAGNAAYDASVAARNYTLYGEHEPTRAAPGHLVMPHEHYRCRLQLTEESFHDSGPLAGSWTTAMSAPFEFNIPTSATTPPPPGENPPPGSSTLPLEITRLKAGMNFRRAGHDRAQIQGRFTVPAGFNPANLEVTASVFNASQKYVLNEKGRDNVSGGMFSLAAAGTTATFHLRMHNADFGVTPGVLATSPLSVLTLKISGDTYAGSLAPKTKISGQKVSLTYTKK